MKTGLVAIVTLKIDNAARNANLSMNGLNGGHGIDVLLRVVVAFNLQIEGVSTAINNVKNPIKNAEAVKNIIVHTGAPGNRIYVMFHAAVGCVRKKENVIMALMEEMVAMDLTLWLNDVTQQSVLFGVNGEHTTNVIACVMVVSNHAIDHVGTSPRNINATGYLRLLGLVIPYNVDCISLIIECHTTKPSQSALAMGTN